MGSKQGSYLPNNAMADIHKMSWVETLCVNQYMCTHPKLDSILCCLLEPFRVFVIWGKGPIKKSHA